MTLDMEVPLMPRYLTTPHHHHHQQHPLKLLAGMGAFPPAVLAGDEDPASSPPSSTRDDSSRASSTSSPSSPGVVVSKPPRFSIADILKPDFGGHKATSKSPDQQEKEKNLFEGAVSPGDAHEKQFNTVKVQSVFKEQPLKDRLAFSATDLIGERVISSSKQRNTRGILPHGAFPPAGTKVPVAPHVGGVGPVPLPSFQGPAGLGGATMPPAAAAAYYQSYLSLCQQRYADYVQLYGGGGQHGLLPPSGPMPLAIPPFPTRPLPHGDHTRTAALFSPPPASPDCGSVQKQPPTSPAGDLHHRVQAASSTQHHSVTSQQQFSPTFPASGVHHQHSSSSKFQQHSSDDSQSRHSHVERRPKELSPSPPPSRGSVSSPPSQQQHGAPQSPDSTSRESAGEAASESGKDGSGQQNLWPAWVYCTRYSDRPSSGPRSRKIRRKDKQVEEKRPRTAFTNDQLEYLRREFESNKYLTEERRQRLATELSLTESQIKIWFQNKRAKLKKSCGAKNPLALSLMAQGLYKHGGPGGEGDSGSNQSGADDMELDVDS